MGGCGDWCTCLIGGRTVLLHTGLKAFDVGALLADTGDIGDGALARQGGKRTVKLGKSVRGQDQ